MRKAYESLHEEIRNAHRQVVPEEGIKINIFPSKRLVVLKFYEVEEPGQPLFCKLA